MKQKVGFVVNLKSGKSYAFGKGEIQEFQFMAEGVLYLRTITQEHSKTGELVYRWKRHWFPIADILSVDSETDISIEGEEIEYYKEWKDAGYDLIWTSIEENINAPTMPAGKPSPELNAANLDQAIKEFPMRTKKGKRIES